MKLVRTPLQFAFFLSTIIGFLFLLFQYIYFLITDIALDYFYIIIVSICIWLFSFGLIYFLLEKMITQKIRLLYRTIHNYKITKDNFPVKMNEDLLSAAEDEVMKWADSNREEIEKLKEKIDANL